MTPIGARENGGPCFPHPLYPSPTASMTMQNGTTCSTDPDKNSGIPVSNLKTAFFQNASYIRLLTNTILASHGVILSCRL